MTGVLGGIEMGGTKVVCAVSRDGSQVLAETTFPTGTDPSATLAVAIGFFADMAEQHGGLRGLGVAAFGPCDPDPASPGYGRITTTPKSGWQDTDVLGPLRASLGDLPIGFDTDVDAAALGEARFGAGVGVDSLVYLTVGTGIGGGAIDGGRLVHGMGHPEMGHMPVRRPAAEVAVFDGVCPFHGDCLEGVAAGPAIAARWGVPGAELPPEHPAWSIEADYLGDALASITTTLMPERIVLGGGVGQRPHLLAATRRRLLQTLGGYLRHPALENGAVDYLVAPGLGGRSGVIGALCLADAVVGAR